jgi:hypothetical protein
MIVHRRAYGRTVTSARARAGPDERGLRGTRRLSQAGAGQLWREESGAWSVVHAPAEWAGSPVSGRYVGGCPDETDALNAAGGFGSPDARPERDRLAAIATAYAAVRRTEPGKYAYTSSGARMTLSSRRCEDAPFCGCCD